MQLNKIKLAGFKSFVDPTTVLLPSNLVAVVGPNGCGKSNIIDAITWVMGESSAKYLRGESLTDVIFNGSTSRKPVGQASVELVFDNQDGTLGGEYANYAEIAIKRQINRNADSVYYLNGARCRRKDIIDIFLGTGLGPRSYSIIGQNMISRLIEAKPEEMRIYLEEAAGISKYKERRRETENRIQHTKENLARLNDLRSELDKQLSSLKRQASAAERYKVLKQEERAMRAQGYTLQWRQFDNRLVQYTLQIQQHETGLEAKHAELTGLSNKLEAERDEQRLASEVLQEVQRRFYATGNDITRTEQEIRFHEERKRQWQNDLLQVEADSQQITDQIEATEEYLETLSNDILSLEPEAAEAKEATQLAKAALKQAEDALNAWQHRWDDFNQQAAKNMQIAEVEQTRIQHIEQKLHAIKQEQTKLLNEHTQFNFEDVEVEITALAEQIDTASELLDAKNNELTEIRNTIDKEHHHQKQLTTHLDETRSQLQKMRGEYASLKALQETALGQRDNQQLPWLKENQLDTKLRLAQGIEVEAKWELALEKVLGSELQAICVQSVEALVLNLSELPEGRLALFSTAVSNTTNETTKAATLLEKISSQWSLSGLLAGIYVAETLTEALSLCPTLLPHESVITPEGIWLNANWLRISREKDPASGVFHREQVLKNLAQEITIEEEKQENLEVELETNQYHLKQYELNRDELQKTVNQYAMQVTELQTRKKLKQERLEEVKRRALAVNEEIENCLIEIDKAETELSSSKREWQEAMTHLEAQSTLRDNLTEERNLLRETLESARDNIHATKDHETELQIRLQTSRGELASLKQKCAQLQVQFNQLETRKQTLENELSTVGSVDNLEKTLSILLERRLSIESELHVARSTNELLDQEIRQGEASRQAIEREMSKIRDMLETLRLESQGLKVKSENALEQLKDLGVQLEEILQTLPEGIVLEDLHQQLEQIVQRINRLGPINLVAIEEYAVCLERKEYFDKQDTDLQTGLATLENAIAKIDKETRARFKETFEKVNNRFQELFPAIFGGGRAYLEMTVENLLDAGITVMACPPGKRNSTIHLLSGGEKALTAIALVFSIFHLNPAPFCLLDEVDAPLDDANIGRFCNLVKSMSEKTQFIFISHNKLAIEMAQHLMGITMQEPGVSRLVSVNVEEAITLAGT